MHRATSAFCNRQKPLSSEAGQTEIQPLFCKPAGSVTSGTTDDTGIESCSLGASPTIPPPAPFPRDNSNSFDGPKCTAAAFKPVVGLRDQPPPIPPKAIKEIPPLPPKSSSHSSPKDIHVSRGCLQSQLCSPLLISNRKDSLGISHVPPSVAPRLCDQFVVPRQNFYHLGTPLSDPLPYKHKLTSEGVLTSRDHLKSGCITVTSQHLRQDVLHRIEDYSVGDLQQAKYKSISGSRKKLKQVKNVEHSFEKRGSSSHTKHATPVRGRHADSSILSNSSKKTSVVNKSNNLQSCSLRNNTIHFPCELCSCQLNRHWDTKALSSMPHEPSVRANSTLKASESKNHRVPLPGVSTVEFSQIRSENSLTKSGCGGLQWLSHTLARIFRPSVSREVNKNVSVLATVGRSDCLRNDPGTAKSVDCNANGFQRPACSNVLCGGSLWHRRSKSCTTPKVTPDHSKPWTKNIPENILSMQAPHVCSSPVPSCAAKVLRSSTASGPPPSTTPLSLDRELVNSFQQNSSASRLCCNHSVWRSGRSHPIPPSRTNGSLRKSFPGKPDSSCSNGSVDAQKRLCSHQTSFAHHQLGQQKAFSHRARTGASSHSPTKHHISEATSLDRTLSADSQTNRSIRSFTKRRLRDSFHKKTNVDPSPTSLTSSYSDPELPDEQVVLTARSESGGIPTSSALLTHPVTSRQCCSSVTLCDTCPSSFEQTCPPLVPTSDSACKTPLSRCPMIVHTNEMVQIDGASNAVIAVTTALPDAILPSESLSQMTRTSMTDEKKPVHHIHHIHHVHHVHHHHHHHHHHHSRLELDDVTTSTGTISPLSLLPSCDPHYHSCRLNTAANCSLPAVGDTRLSCCLPNLTTSEPSLNVQTHKLSTTSACHTYNAYDSCTTSSTVTNVTGAGACCIGCKSRPSTSQASRPGSCCSTVCCSCTQQQQLSAPPPQQPPQQTLRIRSPPPPALAPLGPHLQPIFESASLNDQNSTMQSPTIGVTATITTSVISPAPQLDASSQAVDSLSEGGRHLETRSGLSASPSFRPESLSSRSVSGQNGDGFGRTNRSRTNTTTGAGSARNAFIPTSPGGDSQDSRSLFQRSMLELRKMGWYWGPLSFQEAQILLAKRPDGTFLVRDSGHATYILSLSFRVRGETYHTRIEYSQGRFSFWSQPQSHSANTMVEFIEKAVAHSISGQFHYFLQSSAQGQPPVEVPLLYPLSRFQVVPSLRHLARFTILSCIRRDHIDELLLPMTLLSYLKEKQFYVESLETFEEAIRDRPPLEFRPRPIVPVSLTPEAGAPSSTLTRARSRRPNTGSVGSQDSNSASSQTTVRNTSQPNSPGTVRW